MVGPSIMLSRNKGKQPIVSFDEYDTEPEGVYMHTHTWTGVIAPVDYSALAWGIEVSYVGPRLQSPVLLSFDDYKTYIVICTNHVYCLSVFQGSKNSWSFLP